MNPLVIEHDRFRLTYSDGAIRIDFDGNGLLMTLTPEERQRLSKALWYRPSPQAG